MVRNFPVQTKLTIRVDYDKDSGNKRVTGLWASKHKL